MTVADFDGCCYSKISNDSGDFLQVRIIRIDTASDCLDFIHSNLYRSTPIFRSKSDVILSIPFFHLQCRSGRNLIFLSIRADHIIFLLFNSFRQIVLSNLKPLRFSRFSVFPDQNIEFTAIFYNFQPGVFRNFLFTVTGINVVILLPFFMLNFVRFKMECKFCPVFSCECPDILPGFFSILIQFFLNRHLFLGVPCKFLIFYGYLFRNTARINRVCHSIQRYLISRFRITPDRCRQVFRIYSDLFRSVSVFHTNVSI